MTNNTISELLFPEKKKFFHFVRFANLYEMGNWFSSFKKFIYNYDEMWSERKTIEYISVLYTAFQKYTTSPFFFNYLEFCSTTCNRQGNKIMKIFLFSIMQLVICNYYKSDLILATQFLRLLYCIFANRA